MPRTLTDLGAVAGYVLGSMAEGSTTLTLETAEHSIRVGHMVIVEIGGEAGAGARATVGVGGTWPATSYADLADLTANWTHPATTDGSASAAYVEDTGDVYYWNGSAIVQPPSQIYHQRKFWPLALVAVVDAVDGAELTLDTASTVATTDAKVWIDSLRVMQDAMHTPGLSLRVPAGVYAVSGRVTNTGGAAMGSSYSDDLTVTGAGATSEFWAPPGCPSTAITYAAAPRLTIRDIVVRANVSHERGLLGVQGYGTGDMYKRPLILSQCHNAVVERVTVISCEWGGIALTGCYDGVMRDCRLEFPTPRHYYLGIWALGFADCINCHSYDCVVDSDYLCTGAEHFKSVDCTHNNVVTRNGQVASNSSHNSWYHGLTITIEADSARPLDHDPLMAANSTVVVDWNKNAAPNGEPEGGGVTGFVFRQEGAIGQDFEYAWAFSRASTLTFDGNPITLEDWDVELGGHFTQGVISAIGGAPGNADPQPLLIDGIVGDGRADLVSGSITNAELTQLRYRPSSVVLGANLDIPLIQGVL